ncbi:MAG TPA: histidine kinase [Ruminiclostridium sp.]
MTIYLIDKLIIFIACFALFALDAGYGISVAPVIISLTISALNSYLDTKLPRLVFVGAYILVCQWQPQFLVFLPLICYDVFATKEQIFSLLVLIPIVSHLSQFSLTLRVMLTLLLMISYLLKFRTQSFNKMIYEFTKYRDTSKERSILLQKKNSDLMEKQDYEMNVATLKERNRIAMEIHDNVGHLLSRCLLQIGAIMSINKAENLKESLSSVKDTMSQAMDSIRNSVHNLHDDAIDLYSQVRGLVTGFTFCSVHLDYDLSDNVNNKLKYCFISILKEALSNIIKHSHATEVNVALREHPALFQLIIQDNGHVSGYNLEDGIGLTNIEERVLSFNGNIHINIETGFKIFISIPKGK